MASQVAICNLATSMMGAKPLLSMDEDTKSARIFRRIWDITRDEVLRDHPWNFAIKRVILGASTTPPAFGFANSFPLPADYIRLQFVGQDELDDAVYEVEGRAIVSDESVIYLKYTSRITDTSLFDAKFAAALAARLAFYSAYAITASPGIVKNMEAIYEALISGATGADGQEGGAKVVQANLWIDSRK
jgi:hypothetical protein